MADYAAKKVRHARRLPLGVAPGIHAPPRRASDHLGVDLQVPAALFLPEGRMRIRCPSCRAIQWLDAEGLNVERDGTHIQVFPVFGRDNRADARAWRTIQGA